MKITSNNLLFVSFLDKTLKIFDLKLGILLDWI